MTMPRQISTILASLKLNPDNIKPWYQLIDSWNDGLSSFDAKVLETALLSELPATGMAGFFRAFCLDIITEQQHYLPLATTSLLHQQAIDLELWVFFYNYAWQKAFLKAETRAQFQFRLRQLNLPQLLQKINYALRAKFQINLPVSRPEVKRIALIAPQLSHIKHPPTLMVLQQFKCLMAAGYEVRLYTAQEMQAQTGRVLLPGVETLASKLIYSAEWQNYGIQDHNTILGNTEFPLLQRVHQILLSVVNFNPDLIFSLGWYSAVAASLYPVRPVISLGINSIKPMQDSDLYLSARESTGLTKEATWGEWISCDNSLYHPYRLQVPAQTAPTELARAKHASKLVLLTIAGQAEQRIHGPWAQGICDLLEKYPDLSWLIIGGDGVMPSALRHVPAHRIVRLANQNDILPYFSQADIYINPPMMGGGFAVAEAMSMAVPALSLNESDGGDKLGQLASANLSTYFEQLEKLILDPEYRHQYGLRLQQRYQQDLNLANSTDNLKLASQLACQEFRTRVAF